MNPPTSGGEQLNPPTSGGEQVNPPTLAGEPRRAPATGPHTPAGIAKNASVLMALTMVSRVAGLVRDFCITHFFGASGLTDVFYLAFTIPNVLRRLVAEGTLTAVVQPAYQRVRTQHGDVAARAFYASVFGYLTLVVVGLLLLGLVGARGLVYAFASGFATNPAKFELCVTLTRWLFPGIVAMSLVGLSMAVLNAHEVYAVPALAPIVLNVSMIGFTILGALTFAPDHRIYGIVVGVLVGSVLQVLVQQPALLARGLLVRPRFVLSDDVKSAMRSFLPGLFGLAVYQLNIIVLRQFASDLGDGAVSYYYTADRLNELAVGVFAVAIAQGAFSTMNSHAANNRIDALVSTWRYAIILTTLVAVPAAFGLAVLAKPFVSVLFLHGKFTWNDVTHTAAVSIGLAPGLIAVSGTRATAQVFYALKDMRTPVKVSAVVLVSNLLLGLYLRRFGVPGLALTLSCSCFLQTGLLVVLLRRRMGTLQLGSLVRPWCWQVTLAAGAVGAAYAIARLGAWPRGFCLRNIVVLASAMAVAIVLYGAGAVALQLQGVDQVKDKLMRRLKRR